MAERRKYLGIKEFRERKMWAANMLARNLGVSPSTYGNWEKGKRDPSFGIVQKLLELGATTEELFGVPAAVPSHREEPENNAWLKEMLKEILAAVPPRSGEPIMEARLGAIEARLRAIESRLGRIE